MLIWLSTCVAYLPFILYICEFYIIYIYVCVDARYNYILCIVMYILIQIVIEYDSTKLFFRECAFQPFLVLVQHHHFEKNVAEHVAAHIICIYIYCGTRTQTIKKWVRTIPIWPSLYFKPNSKYPAAIAETQKHQFILRRSPHWLWVLSLWTRIKLLQINYNMAMAQTHVPFVVHI